MDQNEKNIVISPTSLVTVTKMNHITEIQYMKKKNTKQNIKKISKTEYVLLETGEIKQFETTDKRIDNIKSLQKTFKNLRYLINNNFQAKKNELFITLTFAPDSFGWRPSVSDTEYLSKSFKQFVRRLKRKFGSVDFIRVLEPHEDGKAHYHVLLRFNDFKSIYISNSDFSDIWKNGFVTVHSLKDVDNVGAYVSSYFTDVELNEKTAVDECDSEFETEILEKNGKKFIKGGRLRYYPTGVQIYNKSKGILKPIRTDMFYMSAKKIAGSGQPTFEKNIFLNKNGFSNEIRFESYNSKR